MLLLLAKLCFHVTALTLLPDDDDGWMDELKERMTEWIVTNYRLHLVYTVFYLYSILVVELMHVSTIVQPTLYITVLHTSHILVNY